MTSSLPAGTPRWRSRRWKPGDSTTIWSTRRYTQRHTAATTPRARALFSMPVARRVSGHMSWMSYTTGTRRSSRIRLAVTPTVSGGG